jgi:hypothetical protein
MSFWTTSLIIFVVIWITLGFGRLVRKSGLTTFLALFERTGGAEDRRPYTDQGACPWDKQCPRAKSQPAPRMLSAGLAFVN